MAIKLTVNLPEETVEAVQQIAKENRITVTEALRQLLDNQRYLHNAVSNGSKILLEAPNDKRQREVVFSTSRGIRDKNQV
jgi:hypothetical protein